jgi:hypothetical protein
MANVDWKVKVLVIGGIVFVVVGFLWSLYQLARQQMVLTPMDFLSTGLGFLAFGLAYNAWKSSPKNP